MSRPAVDIPATDDGQARITRGAAWIVLSIGLEGVLNYAYAIVATRLLSAPEYTVFAAGQALLLIVGTASGTSIPWVLSRSLARAGGDRRARSQAVQFAIAANLAFSALAATIVWVVARSFADTSTAVLVAVAMALMFVASTVWGYLNGDQRFRTVAGTRVAEVLGKVATGVTLMALGLGALGGLAGFAIGSGIVLAAGLIYMRADLGRPGRLTVGGALLRTTAGTTLIQAALAVLTSADVILVAILDIPKGQAATYQVAMLLGRVPLFVAGAVALAVFPNLAARPGAMQPLVASSMRLLHTLMVPVALVIATVPASLLLLVFGQEYRGVARLVPLAACTGALGGLVTMLATYLQADDRFLRGGLVLLAGAGLQAVAIWSGWRVGGVMGVAWGVLLTALAIALALLAPAIRAWPGSFRPRLSDAAGWAVAGTCLLLARGTPALWVALATVLGLLVARRAFSARPAPTTSQPIGRRPRILHLGFEDFHRPGAGGGSIRTHEINRRLASAFDVTVVAAKFPGWQDRVEDGVRYVHVGLEAGYFTSLITYFMALPGAVRRFEHDLVIEDFGAPISSALVPLYARAPCLAVVQWLWAKEKARQYHLPFHWFERAGVRLHHRMVTPSDDLAGRLRAANSAAEVHVIPNGVDTASFDVVKPRRQVALFLGRLEMEQKGLDLLLHAFATVAHQTTARLEIAGDGRDRAALEARCRRLGIADRVDFLGRVDGPAKLALLASAQLVCMPSRRETFGMVAVEALACGTPILASDIDNLRHLVRPGTGRLVPAEDPVAYARALLQMLRSPQRCRELGARGREFARGFDWDHIAGQQELVYRRALALNGGRVQPRGALHVRLRGRLERLPWAVWTGPLLAVFTLAVRLVHLDKANEVHLDEVIYRSMAVSFSEGHLPAMPGEGPFFLHPPGYFVLLAGWRALAWRGGGDIFQELYALRGLNIVLGAVTAWLLYAIVRKVANPVAGVAAATMFALDPFALRQNGRSFLETATMMWLLAGYLGLLILQSRPGRNRWLAVVTGLLLGLAIVTKDFASVLVAISLGWATIRRNLGLPRRTIGVVAAAACIPYAIWVLIVVATGHGGDFLASKTIGLLRATGLRQETGFNAEGPPVAEVLTRTVHLYGISYLLAAAGIVAAVGLLASRRPDARLLGLLGVSAVAWLAYAVLFGTIEEQFLYFLLIPALLTVPVAWVQYRSALLPAGWSPRAVRGLGAVVLLMVLAGGAVQWVLVRQRPDDGWRRTIAWLEDSVPPGSTVVVSGRGKDTVDGLVLTRYKVTEWHSPQARKVSRVRWVVIPSALVDDGYVAMTPTDADQIRAAGAVVFSSSSPTLGRVEIVRISGRPRQPEPPGRAAPTDQEENRSVPGDAGAG